LRRRRRPRVTAQGGIGGNLDQDDLDAIGVLDPHFDQPAGFRGGLPDDGDPDRGLFSGGAQPGKHLAGEELVAVGQQLRVGIA
jgi:hypothetical protein